MSIADVQIRSYVRQLLNGLREDVDSGDIPYERTPHEGVVVIRYRTSARDKVTGQNIHGLVMVAVSEQEDTLDLLEGAWPKSGDSG